MITIELYIICLYIFCLFVYCLVPKVVPGPFWSLISEVFYEEGFLRDTLKNRDQKGPGTRKGPDIILYKNQISF